MCGGKRSENAIKVPRGYGIVSDSAFKGSGDLATKVFKPLTESQFTAKLNQGVSLGKLVRMLRAHRAAVSVRQGVEWGIGSQQNVFQRITTTLSANHQHRLLDLEVVVRLFNFRTCATGINQIRTVYADDWGTISPV